LVLSSVSLNFIWLSW